MAAMPGRIQDKVCVVTGAAAGIGRAVAARLAEEGGRVVLADIDVAAAEEAAAEIPGAAAFPVDVPTCPSYQGVRVSIRKSEPHRIRVRLDNVRNSEATHFRVVLGGDTTRHRVPATEVRRVGAPLHRVTRVRVYVGQHLVARARLHP